MEKLLESKSKSLTGDALFLSIEQKQNQLVGNTSWGNVLDAGTGRISLKWLLSCPTDSIVAVTGNDYHATLLKGENVRPCDEILSGNWTDDQFLLGRKFDVIIADQLLERLKRHLQTNGRLYIIGLQPLSENEIQNEGHELILEMAQTRDACIKLAGHQCYREYPVDWIARSLSRSGYSILGIERYANVYKENTIERQLEVARKKLCLFHDDNLAKCMENYLHSISTKAKQILEKTKNGSFHFGFDYVVSAKL